MFAQILAYSEREGFKRTRTGRLAESPRRGQSPLTRGPTLRVQHPSERHVSVRMLFGRCIRRLTAFEGAHPDDVELGCGLKLKGNDYTY